ncbi:hypothetical protein Pla100_35060 [Neorhodopirellula pilleata]|uniref:Uncharacterized protein n=1 Tax=Neorhodopirellula pilleata TaxID=2714738 RepID=A0A5C6A6B1_9BACT|nr:hypothetical protein Pla100_35060 [Neorhodopirellula pilleata]
MRTFPNPRRCPRCKHRFEDAGEVCTCPECEYRFVRGEPYPRPGPPPREIDVFASSVSAEIADQEYIDVVLSNAPSFTLSFHEAARKRVRRVTGQSRGVSDGTVSATRLTYNDHSASCTIDQRISCRLENGKLVLVCCDSVYLGPTRITVTFAELEDYETFKSLFLECLRASNVAV